MASPMKVPLSTSPLGSSPLRSSPLGSSPLGSSPLASPPRRPPLSPGKDGFLLPSPLPTRRTRTRSTSLRASAGPVKYGIVKDFCRQKGHGFIKPDDGSDDIFVHISDIDGEYVLKDGDQVTYKECPIPPKNIKVQAIEVTITNLAPGTTHERWEDYNPRDHIHDP
ncbi:PREDICTED: calcium-regulated heat-stable protein 1-like [Branchiostoma belcheri]|uniref:Calcium-regulated heat-stable protein 1-like n=1 Tax=Branchiostoma belcheri TaxID=7741 RepID=A0A6P4XSN2_BRABE|nr:PREDICTED: calcium-regulated heat-stable protein 1-like [Branchiostoma belcheri]